MLDLTLKFLKWLLSIVFFIAGVYCLRIVTDTGNIKPMIIAVFCFGIVFWTSKATYEAPKNIMLGSVAVLIVSGLLTKYFVYDLASVFFSSVMLDMGFYSWWAVSAFVLGLPVMLYLFKKADKK